MEEAGRDGIVTGIAFFATFNFGFFDVNGFDAAVAPVAAAPAFADFNLGFWEDDASDRSTAYRTVRAELLRDIEERTMIRANPSCCRGPRSASYVLGRGYEVTD